MDKKTKFEKMGNAKGWKMFFSNKSVLRFSKGGDQVWIYPKRDLIGQTISTMIDHPKGRTILYRNNVDTIDISRIFSNPRAHTNRGTRPISISTAGH